MEDIKIYNPLNVIDNLDNHGLPVKITCIECCNSRLFVGTLEGLFFEYFITEDETSYSKVRSTVLGKGQGQPIIYIRSASALDSLIILSGGTLALYDLQTLEIKGSNNAGNVTAVSVDENPVSGDPFIVELCFSRKTSIFICHVSSDGFKLVREINVDSLALSISVESGLICAALAIGHYVMVNANSSKKSVQKLCDFDSREVHAKVVHVKKEEFLVLGPGSLGVFVTSAGTSERPPILWPDKVNQVAVHNFNVVAACSDSIYVHSLIDPTHCASVRLPNAKSLQVIEGNLYAWTGSTLYKFNAISIEDQVESLLATDDVSKAFNLLQNAGPDSQQYLASKIHRKAVFTYLASFDYESARNSITEGGVDLREILLLYKNALPASSTFTQSLPPLHRYSDISQITKEDESTLREMTQFVIELLLEDEKTNSSQDLSTSLLKLTARFDPVKYKQLLRRASSINADFLDVLVYFNTLKLYSKSGFLYRALGNVEKSLDLWLKLASGDLSSEDENVSDIVGLIIDILVDCNDPVIVWNYFFKLQKVDSLQSIEVLKRKPISEHFQPLQVAEKLHSIPDLCIDYLEHVIYEKKVDETEIHTYLATLYIERILESKSGANSAGGSDSRSIRDKLLQLIVESNNLRYQFLIGKLKNTTLRQELAILHGKAGDHAHALIVMTRELNDHNLAREYCRKLGVASDKQRAYLELLRLYINVSREKQDSENLVAVLSDFIQDFDLLVVLSLLPDEIQLSTIAGVLQQATRIAVHRRRRAKMIKALSSRNYFDSKLEEIENNFGFATEEESLCDACNKVLDGIDTIAFSDGLVGHDKCLR